VFRRKRSGEGLERERTWKGEEYEELGKKEQELEDCCVVCMSPRAACLKGKVKRRKKVGEGVE
jgi:hypothetical protein